MVFNCSETRSQKNRQLSSRTCTRRPEDNGKKMVSKKKFIDYKNHFEGGVSTSTWLHAAINHDICSAGGCVFKRIKRNDRKVRSEKKRRFDRKGRRKIKFDQMHFIPSILSSLASLEVPGPTKSPLA